MRSAVAAAPPVGTDEADGIGRRLQHAVANRIGVGTADRSGRGRIEANKAVAGHLLAAIAVVEQGNRNQLEPESREELMRFLAQTPILPLEGASPIALTKTAFDPRSVR